MSVWVAIGHLPVRNMLSADFPGYLKYGCTVSKTTQGQMSKMSFCNETLTPITIQIASAGISYYGSRDSNISRCILPMNKLWKFSQVGNGQPKLIENCVTVAVHRIPKHSDKGPQICSGMIETTHVLPVLSRHFKNWNWCISCRQLQKNLLEKLFPGLNSSQI